MADIIDPRFSELLEEYIEHRAAIKSMIKDLEEIKGSVNTLIPKKLEVRYARFFEEKVKAVTALFGSLLDMRKEIAKSVKDEIDIRRKISGGDDAAEELEKYLNVRDFADKVTSFQKEKEKIIKKREDKETLPEEIEAMKIDKKGVIKND